MWNELDIEEMNKKILNKYSKNKKIILAILIIILIIVVFIQKELITRILTILTTIAIYSLMNITGGLKKTIKTSINNKNYKIIETEITNKYIYNSSSELNDNSSNRRCLEFKDTNLIFEIDWMDNICNVGDKVLLQIIEYKGNEYIINLMNLTNNKKILHFKH
ncbi:MAG: hypothetical protein E7174_01495 [Firmicutes bacterium]|nr:hypothetical protein [Bacillota bacterium]